MGVVAEQNNAALQGGASAEMRQYLKDIGQFPLLDEQQERALTIRCAEGDEEAIRLLVCSNLRLVVNVARMYAGRGVPLMDLVQEGSVGLLNAAKKFDPSLGFRFSTYATKWIHNGVLRSLTEHGAIIQVSGYAADKLKKVARAQQELAREQGQEPTVEMLAQRIDADPQKLREFLQMVPQVYSLDAPLGEDALLSAYFEENLIPPPQKQLLQEELSRVMETLLNQLTDRQRLILRLRFGMEDGLCHSFDSIGQRLDISKQRVRQIAMQAMERLKERGAEFGLEEFLDE